MENNNAKNSYFERLDISCMDSKRKTVSFNSIAVSEYNSTDSADAILNTCNKTIEVDEYENLTPSSKRKRYPGFIANTSSNINSTALFTPNNNFCPPGCKCNDEQCVCFKDALCCHIEGYRGCKCFITSNPSLNSNNNNSSNNVKMPLSEKYIKDRCNNPHGAYFCDIETIGKKRKAMLEKVVSPKITKSQSHNKEVSISKSDREIMEQYIRNTNNDNRIQSNIDNVISPSTSSEPIPAVSLPGNSSEKSNNSNTSNPIHSISSHNDIQLINQKNKTINSNVLPDSTNTTTHPSIPMQAAFSNKQKAPNNFNQNLPSQNPSFVSTPLKFKPILPRPTLGESKNSFPLNHLRGNSSKSSPNTLQSKTNFIHKQQRVPSSTINIQNPNEIHSHRSSSKINKELFNDNHSNYSTSHNLHQVSQRSSELRDNLLPQSQQTISSPISSPSVYSIKGMKDLPAIDIDKIVSNIEMYQNSDGFDLINLPESIDKSNDISSFLGTTHDSFTDLDIFSIKFNENDELKGPLI